MESELLVQKVSYKGFIHCDNPAREPNAITIQGIHKIFSSKKSIKQAQADNPLACRGFKKTVIMTISGDGFRLDMLSGELEGALLQAKMSKIVLAVAVEKYVYVVSTRTQKPGKYLCHCIMSDTKEDKCLQIAKFIEVAAKLAKEKNAGGFQARDTGTLTSATSKTIHNDRIAADARNRSSCLVGLADSGDHSNKLDDYLADPNAKDDFDENNLSAWDLRELRLDAAATPAKAGEDPIVNAMGWYHGTLGRDAAEKVLAGQENGSYFVRFSKNTQEYCISLVNNDGVIQHFATSTSQDGSLRLQGHTLTYEGLIRLIDHYSRYDITSKGDRVVIPIGKNGLNCFSYTWLLLLHVLSSIQPDIRRHTPPTHIHVHRAHIFTRTPYLHTRIYGIIQWCMWNCIYCIDVCIYPSI
eukprot:m.108677 g.108677  ORF g.108677 m.108677 type:complete len:412 (+) comp27894_c3_seq3:237-1472(+)